MTKRASPPDPYADVPMGPVGASDFPLASPDPAAPTPETECNCIAMYQAGAYPTFFCDKHGYVQTSRIVIDAIVQERFKTNARETELIAERDTLAERLAGAERKQHMSDLNYDALEKRAESAKAAHKAMSETAANMCLEIARRDDLLVKEKQARGRAEKDAARYRVLRERKSIMLPRIVDPLNDAVMYTPDGLDAAIDAALAQEPK